MDGIKKISENVIRPGRALTLTNVGVKDYEAIPVGTLRCNQAASGLEFKQNELTWSKFNAEGLLLDGSITTKLLANKCVTNPKIDDQAVDTRTLADSSVTTIKIKDLNVITEKLANLSVTTPKIADAAVTTPKIKDGNVTTTKIANKNITTEKLADYSVTEIKIADQAVVSRSIRDLNVFNNHIANRTIQHIKYGVGSVYGAVIPDEGIETVHLRNSAVTTIKIANGAVMKDKIAPANVLGTHIADSQVGSSHLINSSVISTKIADSAVTTAKIQDNSVTMSKITAEMRNILNNAIVHDAYGDVKIRRDLRVTRDIYANRVFNAVYNDLAEGYIPGEKLNPGEIVEIREDGKVYKAKNCLSNAIVGVVSDEYATCFGATNEELERGEKIAVGLIGKVHVLVDGPVKVGQRVGCKDMGIGKACNSSGYTIGKALETNTNEGTKKVLCLIYPN